MKRKNASGTRVSAQKNPASRSSETPRNVPRGETSEPGQDQGQPRAREHAGIDQRVRQRDDRAAAVGRRPRLQQGIERDEQEPAEDPHERHDHHQPGQAGADRGEGQRADGQAEGPQREQAVFDLRPRQPAGQQAARADAQPQRDQRQARLPLREAQDLRRVGQDRRGHQAGDRPDEHLADDGQPQHAIGADGLPGDPDGRAQPPLGPRRRHPRDRQRRQQAAGREPGQERGRPARAAHGGAAPLWRIPAPPTIPPGSPGSSPSPARRWRPRAAGAAPARG